MINSLLLQLIMRSSTVMLSLIVICDDCKIYWVVSNCTLVSIHVFSSLWD